MSFKIGLDSKSPPAPLRVYESMTPGSRMSQLHARKQSLNQMDHSDPMGPASITGAKLGKTGVTFEDYNMADMGDIVLPLPPWNYPVPKTRQRRRGPF